MNIQKSSGKTSTIVLYALAGLIVALVIFYGLGYRVGKFGIAKVHAVTIKNLPEDTQIFLDNKSIGFDKGDVELKLTPSAHSIILSRAGFWPYLENLEIKKDDPSTTINPFFFLQNPSGVLIGSNDPEYLKIISLFNKKLLPTSENPVKSEDGRIALFINEGRIYAENIDKTGGNNMPRRRGDISPTASEIFNPVTEIRNIAFYKDRNDVMLISMQDGIFAIEIDPTGVQNLQPIIEGTTPDFRLGENGELYVQDGKTLMLVSI